MANSSLIGCKVAYLSRSEAETGNAGQTPCGFFRAMQARGHIHNLSRNYNAAVADLTAAIRIDHNYAKAYYKRSRAYLALGDKVRSSTDFKRALKLDPNVEKD